MQTLKSRYLTPEDSCDPTSDEWQRDQRSKKKPRQGGTGEKGPMPCLVETEYEPQLWLPGRLSWGRGRDLARGGRRDIQALWLGGEGEEEEEEEEE